MSSRTEPSSDESEFSPTIPILLQLPRPLLDYRIIIAVLKGDVGAVDILKDALNISKELNLPNPILALGPTTPLPSTPHRKNILQHSQITTTELTANASQ
jgi:hypothetical protein